MSLHPLDRMPAVRRIDTDRPDLFAVEISGYVTSADVENLFGLLEGAYEISDRLDVLVRLVDYEGAEWQAVDRDTMDKGRRHALQHVRRCASVGEPDWTSSVGGFFSNSLPVEFAHFPLEREQEAWDWLGASPGKA